MPMPGNIVAMLCDGVENHLCVAGIELLQAALDDMVAVAIQDQAQCLRLQLVYEQSSFFCSLNLHRHTHFSSRPDVPH